jgi:hypothetical protein
MAHLNVRPPHDRDTHQFDGEGREPVVSNPKHVAGQGDIRPNFEQKSEMHSRQPRPINPKLPEFKGHRGPLD